MEAALTREEMIHSNPLLFTSTSDSLKRRWETHRPCDVGGTTTSFSGTKARQRSVRSASSTTRFAMTSM